MNIYPIRQSENSNTYVFLNFEASLSFLLGNYGRPPGVLKH